MISRFLAFSLSLAAPWCALASDEPTRPPVIDVHVHVDAADPR